MFRLFLFVLFTLNSTLIFAQSLPPDFPELKPIESPQLACGRYNSEGEPVLSFFFAKKGYNDFQIWQADSIHDLDGLELDILTTRTLRCPGCYQIEAAFGQPGNGVLLYFDIENMDVSYIPHAPGLKVTISPYPPVEDGEEASPVVWDDFKCTNLNTND